MLEFIWTVTRVERGYAEKSELSKEVDIWGEIIVQASWLEQNACRQGLLQQKGDIKSLNARKQVLWHEEST